MTHPEPHLKARDLVLQHGENAASYQIVNPVIDIWLSQTLPAAIGYVDRSRIRVLAGEPVCPHLQTEQVIQELRAQTTKAPCIFAARAPTCPGFEGTPIIIGKQPIWNPATWKETVLADSNLRQQFNRAKNKGVTVTEWSTEKATSHPTLQKIVDVWLDHRGLPPLHFLVEPQTLSFLEDRRTFVAEQNGTPVAFLNLCPIPLRNGWLTEQFPRLPNAPNGTVELLMHQAALTLAEEKYYLLTMGMVPLASPVIDGASPLVRFLLAWTRAHARRFYNFDGLYYFKNKFHPDAWEDLYLLPSHGKVSLKHLIACSEAFTENPLGIAIPRALLRAFRQEIRWITQGKKK